MLEAGERRIVCEQPHHHRPGVPPLAISPPNRPAPPSASVHRLWVIFAGEIDNFAASTRMAPAEHGTRLVILNSARSYALA
jgi:hypothetical protein